MKNVKMKLNLEFRDLVWERQMEILEGLFPGVDAETLNANMLYSEELLNTTLVDEEIIFKVGEVESYD